jgi:WD repeat-containing protein 35
MIKIFKKLNKFIIKAEILAFLHKFEEAENIFKKIERKDLQLKLRMRLGDWT